MSEDYRRGWLEGRRRLREEINAYLLSEWDRIGEQMSGKDGRTREYLTTVVNTYETVRGCLLDLIKEQ